MLAVRLDPETEALLETLAREKSRTKSDLVREALHRYLDEDRLLADLRRQSLACAAHERPDAATWCETLDAVEGWEWSHPLPHGADDEAR